MNDENKIKNAVGKNAPSEQVQMAKSKVSVDMQYFRYFIDFKFNEKLLFQQINLTHN